MVTMIFASLRMASRLLTWANPSYIASANPASDPAPVSIHQVASFIFERFTLSGVIATLLSLFSFKTPMINDILFVVLESRKIVVLFALVKSHLILARLTDGGNRRLNTVHLDCRPFVIYFSQLNLL